MVGPQSPYFFPCTLMILRLLSLPVILTLVSLFMTTHSTKTFFFVSVMVFIEGSVSRFSPSFKTEKLKRWNVRGRLKYVSDLVYLWWSRLRNTSSYLVFTLLPRLVCDLLTGSEQKWVLISSLWIKCRKGVSRKSFCRLRVCVLMGSHYRKYSDIEELTHYKKRGL